MNIGFWSCIILVIPFVIIGVLRNQCFIWTVIMLAGATLSCLLTPYMAIPTYIIWLVLFFREVHFDNHKAFKKYLLK